MTRRILIALGLFVLAISVLALRSPHSDLGSFLTINQNFTIMRLAGGTFMLFYGLFLSFRMLPMRLMLRLMGIAAIAMGTIGIYFLYMLPIDIFIFLAGGIYAVLAGIEIPVPEAQPISFRWLFIPQLILPRLTRNVQTTLSRREQPMAKA